MTVVTKLTERYWRFRRELRLKLRNLRHRLASKLIGHDTTRAIYPGPGAMDLEWKSNVIYGHAIFGAATGFHVEAGVITTRFDKVPGWIEPDWYRADLQKDTPDAE